jgi:hypothetical protein
MTGYAPARRRHQAVISLAVWLGIGCWGVFVCYGVASFLRTGAIGSVSTLVGAAAVIYAALLTAAALAHRITDAIVEACPEVEATWSASRRRVGVEEL